MSKISTLPWSLESDNSQHEIRSAEGYVVAVIPIDEVYGKPEEDQANAVRIFSSANLFDEMLIALKTACARLIHLGASGLAEPSNHTIQLLERTIERAEGV